MTYVNAGYSMYNRERGDFCAYDYPFTYDVFYS